MGTTTDPSDADAYPVDTGDLYEALYVDPDGDDIRFWFVDQRLWCHDPRLSPPQQPADLWDHRQYRLRSVRDLGAETQIVSEDNLRSHFTPAERTDLPADIRPREPDDAEVVTDGGATWRDLTGVQRDLVETALRLEAADETVYGMAIRDRAADLREEDINHGRLYPNLDQLVEMGFLDKSKLDERTNQYRPTDLARTVVDERLREFRTAVNAPVATDGGSR